LEFITIPDTYYNTLRERLQTSCTKILEDIEILQKLHILVDYDEEGYLLQVNIQDFYYLLFIFNKNYKITS
jgi:4-hydroxyphenylpyruvate dioxygenase